MHPYLNKTRNFLLSKKKKKKKNFKHPVKISKIFRISAKFKATRDSIKPNTSKSTIDGRCKTNSFKSTIFLKKKKKKRRKRKGKKQTDLTESSTTSSKLSSLDKTQKHTLAHQASASKPTGLHNAKQTRKQTHQEEEKQTVTEHNSLFLPVALPPLFVPPIFSL